MFIFTTTRAQFTSIRCSPNSIFKSLELSKVTCKATNNHKYSSSTADHITTTTTPSFLSALSAILLEPRLATPSQSPPHQHHKSNPCPDGHQAQLQFFLAPLTAISFADHELISPPLFTISHAPNRARARLIAAAAQISPHLSLPCLEPLGVNLGILCSSASILGSSSV
ncbi:hypothetical protein M0R45_019776 [Rubus argutus]|uniref:Uncharacterized protein n=1 Tax=Rubus argutus TaxID=59490 RepID=A0AAW1X785_RUBAR